MTIKLMWCKEQASTQKVISCLGVISLNNIVVINFLSQVIFIFPLFQLH